MNNYYLCEKFQVVLMTALVVL